MSVNAQAILTEFYVAEIVIRTGPFFLGEGVEHCSIVVTVRAIGIIIVGIGRDGQGAGVELANLLVAETGATIDSDRSILRLLLEDKEARDVFCVLFSRVTSESAIG